MNTTISFIIDSLHCYINALPPPNIDGIDFHDLYETSKRQQVCGIIYAMQNGITDFGNEKQNFVKTFIATIQRSTLQSAAYKHFCDFCAKENIVYAPLKGAEIKNLYSDPMLRIMGDMDILVSESDMPTLKKYMNDNSFTQNSYGQCVYEFVKPNVTFELHTQILQNCLPIFEQNIIENNSLDHLQHFIFLICHLKKHILASGVGIRPIFDIALFEHKYNIRPSTCKEVLQQLDSYVFASEIQRLIDKMLFSATVAEEAYDSDDIAIIDYIFQSDNFGFENRSRGSSLSAGKKSTSIALFAAIFPNKNVLYTTYPRLAKHKFLLPWYYVVRIFSKLRNGKHYSKIIKQALSDTEESQHFRKVHKKLGL